MKFIYGRQDFKTMERGEENCYLMTNGLGGFSSLTMAGSCSRNDHALLMSCPAEEAPNHRYNMVHRLEEVLIQGEQETYISTQNFTDPSRRETGYRFLASFSYEDYPVWHYELDGVEIIKTVVMAPKENTVGVAYDIRNRSADKVSLRVTPQLEFVPKGTKLQQGQPFAFLAESCSGPEGQSGYNRARIRSNGQSLYFETNGWLSQTPVRMQTDLYYAGDACDGREETGCTAMNHTILFNVRPGVRALGEILYSTVPIAKCWSMRRGVGGTFRMAKSLTEYRNSLRKKAGFADETAQALAVAAEQFVSYRASTDKQTILAGFPFFEDWGRDTMIALSGCCLSVKQYEVAESILRTFMLYCKKGLMPNLFPEGKQEPRYNTVDAALLFILAVYEYFRRTRDRAFVTGAWSVMREIIDWYRQGTDYNIAMEEDGLLRAGEGYDQVTWMDVRIGDILPTPRHGKPVEINAYWYNALCVMDFFKNSLKGELPEDETDYGAMAERTKVSFREKFWNEEAGCLKDVLSAEGGTDGTGGGEACARDQSPGEGAEAARRKVCPDTQIRCNQIWAVSLPFSLLDRDREKQVVETVFRKLYTPLGLRTLDPEDPEFQPVYEGEQLKRDLAYHQGTVWAYPLGGYYLAYLKVNEYSEEAKADVRAQLESITAALREGCIGQLPEIYDGGHPVSSKGCFAQAWSVGEILRVYEALEMQGETV
ncbi:MAG: amylo-alpha-1,6-glucosidase [Lachnospiraceae bacterium]|nr:amylo-alpha-1,6-glucosidase [Lachnospiraceae bacterium]